MLRSLFSGVSGVKTQTAFMDVLSNNIANINTTGFKSGRITFSDTLSDTLSGARGSVGNFGGVNPSQIGLGAKISSIDTNFKQGNMEATGINTDLAIVGNGFFVVNDGKQNLFTRAGAFQIDNDGNLMAQGGSTFVQGRMADENGVLSSTTEMESIKLPFGKKDPAHATENLTLFCNLDKDASQSEEWKTQSKLQMDDGSDLTLAADLNSLKDFDLIDGDILTITGTNRDDEAISVEFTYGTTGTTLGQFIDSMNSAFNSSDATDGATISLDEMGFLRLNANTAGETDFSIAIVPPTSVEAIQRTCTSATTYEVAGAPVSASSDLSAIDGVTLANLDTFDLDFTNPDGTTGTSTFTYNTGDTVQDLLTFIEAEMTGVEATISGTGELIITNVVAGPSNTTFLIDDGGTTGLERVFTEVDGRNATTVTFPAFTQEEAGLTGTHSTAITVYDSLGNTHELNFNFTQDLTPGSNLWTWEILVDDGTIIPTNSSNTGQVSFNENGSLKEFTYDSGASKLTFNLEGAKGLEIDINPGTSGFNDGITQFSSPSTTISREQDGYTLGTINNMSVDELGLVTGFYSNGQSRTIGQIAMADFTNRGGLMKEGGSIYSANDSSGSPVILWGGSNTDSVIRGGFLESSNVDLTQEFSNMIIAQRAIQANSKVVSTSDQILTTIIDRMKR